MPLVFANKPETLNAQEANIRAVIDEIQSQMLRKIGRKYDLSSGAANIRMIFQIINGIQQPFI